MQLSMNVHTKNAMTEPNFSCVTIRSFRVCRELLLEAIANAEQSLIAREAAIHGAMTKLSKYSYKQLANAMKQQHGGSMNPEGCRVRRRDRQSRQVVLASL